LGEYLKYSIIGFGSIGTLIAYALNISGYVPYIVARSGLSLKRVLVDPSGNIHEIRGEIVDLESDMWIDSDVIIICVKAYDIANLAPMLYRVSERATIVTLQNGIGSYETVIDIVGNARAAHLVLNHGAYRKDQNVVIWVGGSTSYIGSHGVPRSILEKIAYDLRILNAKVVEDINSYRWLKLAVNASINPITAILRSKNSVIIENQWARLLAKAVVREIQELCRVLKIDLPRDPLEEVVAVAKATGNNYSSMLMDLCEHGRTEIDYINGYIVREGVKRGMRLVANEVLYYLVKAIEIQGVKCDRG